MNNKIKQTYIICFLLLFTVAGFSASRVGQSKMQFLKLGIDARAAAMGDAYTAIAGDPNSIFYNPAGIAFAEGLNITFNRTDWIADIKQNSALIAYKVGNLGTFSLNFVSMDYGDFERTIWNTETFDNYEKLGTFTVSEYAVGLGYATQITNRLSFGAQARYINQDLGSHIGVTNSTASGDLPSYDEISSIDQEVIFDLGTYYDFDYKGTRIGMSIQNFSNAATPLTFRFGSATNLNEFLFPAEQRQRLTLSFDLLHPRDYEERFHTGLEYAFKEMLFLRAGYKFNYDEEDFTAGAGVKVKFGSYKINIAYAFTKFGVFGHVNRFTFHFQY